MNEDNTGMGAAEPEMVSEVIDQQIEDTKSIETLSQDLMDAAVAFAAAFAKECSDLDMSDVDMSMKIEGRPDGDISISFGTNTYVPGIRDSISFYGYREPYAVMHELFRGIWASRANSVPLITHKR